MNMNMYLFNFKQVHL